jgi:UDP-N-acetylglucosamine 2-epimerase (non-hydrolysing)
MNTPLQLLLIAGARPNFMKIAPLIHALQRHHRAATAAGDLPGRPIHYRLVHTGQHYDEKMSEVFFRELGIPQPEVNLEVGSGSHAAQTAEIMRRFEPVLLHAFAPPPSKTGGPESSGGNPDAAAPALPDWVIVVGDVNSTMACTLVAAKLGVKVAHIEAGLRSRDRTMPEEINRLVTDALADLLPTPSEDANENLRREGVPEAKIKLVGNIMIDSLIANLPQARQSQILQKAGVTPGQFAYVTLHRPANVDSRDSLGAIMRELTRLAQRLPVVFPMHPRTRKMLAEYGITGAGDGALKIIEPVGYHDSLCLTENARLVLTDSGGLQEESTWFRTPCLTLRPNTERPVTVTLGSNRLTTVERLRADFEAALNGAAKTGTIPPLWDGQTAARILAVLASPTAA